MTEFKKVHEGVADLSQTYQLFKRHEDKPWADRISGEIYDGEFWETTEEAYWNFLEMMPPKAQAAGGFAMLEATTANIHSVFYDLTIDGERRYFHVSLALNGRQDMFDARDAIVASVTADADATPTP